MGSFENHKLPVLRDRDATDPARIVRWAKEALTCGQAHPKVLEKYNLLRFCVSEEVREMWAALTDDVEGAPAVIGGQRTTTRRTSTSIRRIQRSLPRNGTGMLSGFRQ